MPLIQMSDKLPLLNIRSLNCGFVGGFGLKDIDLDIYAGERVGLVGESGSGKSFISNMILKLYSDVLIKSGSIEFEGKNLLDLKKKSIQLLRGKEIGYISQEPLGSLNPLHKVGRQVLESFFLHHTHLNAKTMEQKVDEIFLRVGLDVKLKNRYPYELSGGQRQRIAIAMAVINNPKLLICDEPTTALDMSVQKQILDLLYNLSEINKIAILFISHDLGIVKDFVNRVYVMKEGRICEKGQVERVFSSPEDAYTQKLLDALVLPKKKLLQTDKKIFEVKDFAISYTKENFFFGKKENKVLSEIFLILHQSQTIGIVGESGSGKSSFALGVLRLIKSTGEEWILGNRVDKMNQKTFKPYRRDIQIVFQDPYASLNPRMRICDIILEALKLGEIRENEGVEKILESVGLNPSFMQSYPHQLSGGQRQRVAIARAIALRPKIIILDEPTSALDKSTQKIVIELLLKLQKDYGLSYLFISHDLDVIEAVCDDVMVLWKGRMMEYGRTKEVFTNPKNPYTQELLSSRMRV
ncbi:dipeptide ABC transporter ATP-binding protein [Helicobacter cappadocius]|uniref:Dipeptide ABC transporter ATP-binding protein n=1 Tax=Helicobacter cappadocius TaxID=3063998 RepID=A0AA90T9N9_9HELI|nr:MULTISPECIES: dipeptide ABC transporter ATP-binding protein [unclassified Helicobacter]MDO7252948.1 dipeptide ABC transporter ATP-binding protein [Helicobacter sp. faydin-H75]MDP2539062.1 dipeptide ABC transporter ATP-binding protein [Helicobacter sp. faydin-H76]